MLTLKQKKPQNEIISPAAQINNLSYFIVYSISGFPCRQQSHLVELHHERPDRGIGSVAEVLLKLLGGELLRAVGRQNIFPKQPFFFLPKGLSDIPEALSAAASHRLADGYRLRCRSRTGTALHPCSRR